jgi:hypothetical protein
MMSWELRKKPTGIRKISPVRFIKPVAPVRNIQPIRPVKPIAPIGQEYYWKEDK